MSHSRSHQGRPWRERMWPHILRRDSYLCQMPNCLALQWCLNPRPRDRVLAAHALLWLQAQDTPRRIWADAPVLVGVNGGRRQHPLSASVDMIVPLSQGGSDQDAGNARASHLLCNVSRGDGRRGRARYTSAPRIAR